MTHRCTGAFAVGNPPRMFSAGKLVSDNDPILRTHRVFFEPVEETVARQEAVAQSVTAVTATETATAAPGEARHLTTPPARRRVLGGGKTEATP